MREGEGNADQGAGAFVAGVDGADVETGSPVTPIDRGDGP